MPLSDEAIVAKVQRNLEACEPGFIGAQARTPATPSPSVVPKRLCCTHCRRAPDAAHQACGCLACPASDLRVVHSPYWAVLCTQVVDSAVLRFPKAVTHFSPGSLASRPLQATSFGNVFLAGDWVKGVPHGANGLSQVRIGWRRVSSLWVASPAVHATCCSPGSSAIAVPFATGLCRCSRLRVVTCMQERAWVTGVRAANMVVDRLGRGTHAVILPVEPDEPWIAGLKGANRALKSSLEALGLGNPFFL